MFIWFHVNKFRHNEKGQLAPIFIVVTVIVLTMAMVTVNLHKVSLFKTDTSNAADAGGLAAGSAMANLFNSVAITSSRMETAYWGFFARASVSFLTSMYQLMEAGSAAKKAGMQAATGLAKACPSPEAAIAQGELAQSSMEEAILQMEKFIKTTARNMVGISAFYFAELLWYRMIRDNAQDAWESAVEVGHRLAFGNSNVSAKLRLDEPGKDENGNTVLFGEEDKNNYKNSFSDFMDTISFAPEYTYSWKDGQGRQHSVQTQVTIGAVDTFDLQVALLPWPGEMAALLGAIGTAFSVKAEFQAAAQSFMDATQSSIAAAAGKACCSPKSPMCCAKWFYNCAMAAMSFGAGIASLMSAATTTMMIPMFVLAGWAGLLPVRSEISSSDMTMNIIAWINDIVYDLKRNGHRVVIVESTQEHAGADMVFWRSNYPSMYSGSVVSFEGKGKIHPAKPKFDASIIETDVIGEGMQFDEQGGRLEDVSVEVPEE